MLHGQYKKEQETKLKLQTEKVTRALGKRIFKHNVLANSLAPNEFDYYQYQFNPETNQRTQALSSLSNPEYYSGPYGLIGYFQIDQEHNFNNPGCPSVIKKTLTDDFLTADIPADLLERRKLTAELFNIVQKSQRLSEVMAQPELLLMQKFDAILDVPEYLIYYRIAEVNGERKLQGYVVNRLVYLDAYTKSVFNYIPFNTELKVELLSEQEQVHNFYLVSQDGEAKKVEPEQFGQRFQLPLTSGELHWPYTEFTVRYSAPKQPIPEASIYSFWALSVILLTLGLSCLGFYRLGVKQIKHAEQRLNFVSAVSHELKTPVTSIRMYAEMLASGQVLSEQHQQEYYQFIAGESERLTRLIDNVLQLAKLNQPQQIVQPEYLPLTVVEDIVQSKLSSVLTEHGFTASFNYQDLDTNKLELYSDPDVLSQAVINIVDNSIKFFNKAMIDDQERQQIDFNFSIIKQEEAMLRLKIRDHGIGVSTKQLDKLFDLFYRGGDELTRSTQGTGIGLALVKELITAQGGKIAAKQEQPGLSIDIYFNFR